MKRLFLIFTLLLIPARSEDATNILVIDLPTALRLAGAQNLDVRIAQQRLTEAEAAHESARLQFFPWLSPGFAYRRHGDRIQDVAGNIIDAEKQSFSPGAALAAQIDFGDAIYKKLATRQLEAAARHALETQRHEATFTAAAKFFDLSKAHASVAIADEALRISKAYQDQLHVAVDAGLAFRGDELRIQVQTERYDIALRQAREQARFAAVQLALALHLDPLVELQPTDVELATLTLVATNKALDSLVAEALNARPELKQSQSAIAAAKNSRDGAKFGPLVPSVGAQAFFGGLGGGQRDSFGNFGPSEDYSVTLGWRLGPGGLFDSSRVKSADAKLTASRLAEEKVHDQIIADVVEAQNRAQSLADQIAATKRNLQTSTDALQLSEERKEFAVGIVLEVIQAQQDLARARLDYVSAVAEYNKTQYALHRALGSP